MALIQVESGCMVWPDFGCTSVFVPVFSMPWRVMFADEVQRGAADLEVEIQSWSPLSVLHLHGKGLQIESGKTRFLYLQFKLQETTC